MFYRVKEVNGKFIPQKLTVFGWSGIDLISMILWNDTDHQWQYCQCDTLEQAKEVITRYKPKYHSV